MLAQDHAMLDMSWLRKSGIRGSAADEIAYNSGKSTNPQVEHDQAIFDSSTGLHSLMRGIADYEIESSSGLSQN